MARVTRGSWRIPQGSCDHLSRRRRRSKQPRLRRLAMRPGRRRPMKRFELISKNSPRVGVGDLHSGAPPGATVVNKTVYLDTLLPSVRCRAVFCGRGSSNLASVSEHDL